MYAQHLPFTLTPTLTLQLLAVYVYCIQIWYRRKVHHKFSCLQPTPCVLKSNLNTKLLIIIIITATTHSQMVCVVVAIIQTFLQRHYIWHLKNTFRTIFLIKMDDFGLFIKWQVRENTASKKCNKFFFSQKKNRPSRLYPEKKLKNYYFLIRFKLIITLSFVMLCVIWGKK